MYYPTYLKYLVISTFIVLFYLPSVAQIGFSSGVKGGATFTSLRGDQATDVESRTGWVGGLFANVSILEFLAVQPEFLIHQKGATTIHNQNQNEIKVNYFEVPVLIKLRVPIGETFYPNFFAGPNYAYRVSGSFSSSDTQNGQKQNVSIDNIRKSDTGGIVGVGIDIEGQGVFFTLDARYGFGFRTLGENAYSLNVKNENLTVMAGLGFRIGSAKAK